MNGIIGSKRKSIPNMGTPNQIATKHTGRSKRPPNLLLLLFLTYLHQIPTSPQDGVSFRLPIKLIQTHTMKTLTD